MASLQNLRKVSREKLDCPKLAVIYFENEESNTFRFVYVLNFGVQGLLIESDIALNKEFKLKIMFKNTALNQWDNSLCRVAWIQGLDDDKFYKIGLEFLFPIENSLDFDPGVQNEISSQDLDFILNTRLLKTLPKEGVCSF